MLSGADTWTDGGIVAQVALDVCRDNVTVNTIARDEPLAGDFRRHGWTPNSVVDSGKQMEVLMLRAGKGQYSGRAVSLLMGDGETGRGGWYGGRLVMSRKRLTARPWPWQETSNPGRGGRRIGQKRKSNAGRVR